MINLSTPNNQLHIELLADKAKTEYWLIKKFGGQKSYENMRRLLLLQAMKEKRNVSSDVVEYRSSNGNRWMTYECARYYPDAGTSHTMQYAFCFYETLGSVGAFVPTRIGFTPEDGEDAIVIFTSHFFYQMSDRLKLGYRSPGMVRAFHEFIPNFLMTTYQNEGKTKLIVRLPGSTGWGFLREGDKPVFEVRTFLTDEQLNARQRKLSKDLRERAGKVYYEPAEVETKRFLDKIYAGESIAGDVQRLLDKYDALGIDKKYTEDMLDTFMWMTVIYNKMGLIANDDVTFWVRHANDDLEPVYQYVTTANRDGEKFIELLTTCAKTFGFKEFDEGFARIVYDEEVESMKKRLHKLEEKQ